MLNKKLSGIALALSLFAPAAMASCDFESDMEIKSFTASFEAWKVVTAEMSKCHNLRAELDNQADLKQPAAFAVNPSLYHIAGVASSTIVSLLNDNSIRPLDDLVEKYGQDLLPSQLIKIDGKIMAIGMMINTQHLVYRKDILDELQIETPTSYDEVLAAAEIIREKGGMKYPITAGYKTGWTLGLEFANMYISYGGQFFENGNTASINNEKAVKTLEMLKALTEYMDPEYLTADTTVVQKQLQQDKAAMANLWNSRASSVDDPKESLVAGKMGFAAAPSAVPGGKPAATLWWDGFTIASNISDEEAENAFRVALSGLNAEMANSNQDTATWIIKGSEPGPYAKGAIDNAKAGTPAYPATAQLGILLSSAGNAIPDYLLGKSTAEDTLKEVVSKYNVTAKELGLM
ncbi:ABC transporter substrate-binding protein [Vibrio paucivorans]